MKKIIILRHIGIEGPGTLGAYLSAKNIPYEILDIYKDSPAVEKLVIQDISGVVILGGPMNVYEEEKYPFLTVEKAFILKMIAKKIPVLGICLGAQLIACALNAKVKRAPEKEIGWYDVMLEAKAKKDLLFKNFKDKLRVFQWHEDAFDLPKGAVLLARANGINQAFSYKNIVWGVQFHIEVDSAMIHSWCDAYVAEESRSEESWNKLIDGYAQSRLDFSAQSYGFYDAFRAIIVDRKRLL